MARDNAVMQSLRMYRFISPLIERFSANSNTDSAGMQPKSAGRCDIWEKMGVFGSTKDRPGLLAIHLFLAWPGSVILEKSLYFFGPCIQFLMCKTVKLL